MSSALPDILKPLEILEEYLDLTDRYQLPEIIPQWYSES